MKFQGVAKNIIPGGGRSANHEQQEEKKEKENPANVNAKRRWNVPKLFNDIDGVNITHKWRRDRSKTRRRRPRHRRASRRRRDHLIKDAVQWLQLVEEKEEKEKGEN